MIDFDAWLQEDNAPPYHPAGGAAAFAWRRIQEKATSVTFTTPADTVLAAQDVRIEYSDNQSQIQIQSEMGKSVARRLYIFGVANHPDPTVLDTDMKEGYRFVHNNDEFVLLDVIYTIGEVQALAEAAG